MVSSHEARSLIDGVPRPGGAQKEEGEKVLAPGPGQSIIGIRRQNSGSTYFLAMVEVIFRGLRSSASRVQPIIEMRREMTAWMII